MKQSRYLLSDKALPIQRVATQVLIAMFPPETPPSLTDVESILTLCVRSLDGADQLTRSAHAGLVGHLLASTQLERKISVPPLTASSSKGSSAGSSKKGKDPDGGLVDNDETLAPGTPAHALAAVEIAKPPWTADEMLRRLSAQFNKANASRKTKIGLFKFYVGVLQRLGSEWLETNYSLLVAHFMTEIVAQYGSPVAGNGAASGSGGPNGLAKRYERLLACKLVSIVLRDVVGVRMLSEQGQIQAIKELSVSYLKRWPALLGSGANVPGSAVLCVVLKEVAGLVGQLGNLPGIVQVSPIYEYLLVHYSRQRYTGSSCGAAPYSPRTPKP